MRYVVVPQAFRRVLPPLLNDLVSLQKDTGADLDPRASSTTPCCGADQHRADLQLHPLCRRRPAVRASDHPDDPVHRLGRPAAGLDPAAGSYDDQPLTGCSRSRDLRKAYGDHVVLRRPLAVRRAAPVRGADRRVRVGQVDAAALRQPARDRRRRRDHAATARTSPTRGSTPTTCGARIGIVFQSFNLFPHLSVLDNVTLAPRRVHGVPRDEAEARRAGHARTGRPGRQGRSQPDEPLRRPAAAGGDRQGAGQPSRC